MDIVYAAEKPTIASVMSDRLQHRVEAADIDVRDNPGETGSFLIRWELLDFVLSPNGELQQVSAKNTLSLK